MPPRAETAENRATARGERARIDVLDILRGLAILGILVINVPYMAAPTSVFVADVRAIGWTVPDQVAWIGTYIFFSGTQRCVLEFLFGAGMMLMAQRAMAPDGPVAVADLYYRRNLWLLGFGVINAVLLLWPGDILQIYALAALFLFPFRLLKPKWLVTIGLGWAAFVAIGIPEYGLREYVERDTLAHRVTAIERSYHGQPLATQDRAAMLDWRAAVTRDHPRVSPDALAREHAAHAGGWFAYAKHQWLAWGDLVQGWLVWNVIEAFCTMLIGVALWKWRVIQGGRSPRFYLGLMLVSYGFGVSARAVGVTEVLGQGDGPRTIWITAEFARLAIGLGHVALINLAVTSRWGRTLLDPFRAAGRMAFSLYLLQQAVGMYILFAPFGFNLWGRFGWAGMAGIAAAMIATELLIANLWLRYFAMGPLEWLWRSLATWRRQPFARANASGAQANLASNTVAPA